MSSPDTSSSNPNLCCDCQENYQISEEDLLCKSCRKCQPICTVYNGAFWQKEGLRQRCITCKSEAEILYTNECSDCFDFNSV